MAIQKYPLYPLSSPIWGEQMVRKRRGWWSQIQSNDYPETQTKYGSNDWITFNIEKSNHIEPKNEEVKSKESLLRLQNECPICNELYWIDKKRCYNCGWSPVYNNESAVHVQNESKLEEIIQKKDILKVNYTMLCPKCGTEMILRTARKGENKGNKFWGCSKFPKCRGTSSYREIL